MTHTVSSPVRFLSSGRVGGFPREPPPREHSDYKRSVPEREASGRKNRKHRKGSEDLGMSTDKYTRSGVPTGGATYWTVSITRTSAGWD